MSPPASRAGSARHGGAAKGFGLIRRSIFPKELQRPSRRWVERRYTDIRHWNELDRGGHFPALEQPALFVNELRACSRQIR